MGFKILKSGITRRWVINIFTIVFVTICVLIVAGSLAVRAYYISSARQALMNKAESDTAYFENLYTKEPDLIENVRAYAENFSQKEKIELMVANSVGRVTLTSSGFASDTDYPEDVMTAIASDTGSFVGSNSYGEDVILVRKSTVDGNIYRVGCEDSNPAAPEVYATSFENFIAMCIGEYLEEEKGSKAT